MAQSCVVAGAEVAGQQKLHLFLLADWRSIFSDPGPLPGSRLGVPFMRAQLSHLDVTIGEKVVRLTQESEGISAISGVVWDCGLLLTDLLVSLRSCLGRGKCIFRFEINESTPSSSSESSHLSSNSNNNKLDEVLEDSFLDSVLDLGCGTGVMGIVATELGAKATLLTDALKTDSLGKNIDLYRYDDQLERFLKGGVVSSAAAAEQGAVKIGSSNMSINSSNTSNSSSSSSSSFNPPSIKFIRFDWNDDLPLELLRTDSDEESIVFDCLLCSDVLYDEKNHKSFVKTLTRLQFKRCFLAYKRRHEVPEKAVLEALSEHYSIHVFDPACIPLVNLDQKYLTGLHILYITKL